jgi:DNA-binding PadR family transcriptional regulator
MPPAASDLRKQLQKLVPLTPAVFFILLVMVGGEKHGYAIMREVGILSEGKVRMGPGTLYTTIQRLLELGLVVETLAKSQADARRRYYRLTRTGRAVLETEMGRLEALVRLARKRELEFSR